MCLRKEYRHTYVSFDMYLLNATQSSGVFSTSCMVDETLLVSRTVKERDDE